LGSLTKNIFFILPLLLFPVCFGRAEAAKFPKIMASFDAYINSPLRKALTSANNNGTKDTPGHPRADDAGNWTGCRPGVGNLVGTYRDISACMLTQVLGRPATYEDLKALTEQDAKNLIKRWFWDPLKLDQVPHQETADISIHIFMHYGNIRVVQKGLNRLGAGLVEDGKAGPATIEALRKKAGPTAYNAIRDELRIAYENNSVEVYRKPFLDALNKYFPVLSDPKIIFFFNLVSSNRNLVHCEKIEVSTSAELIRAIQDTIYKLNLK